MIREEKINTVHDLDGVMTMLRDAVDEQPHVVAISPAMKDRKRRTLPQNAALHKYCAIMAERMNDGGITQNELVGKFKDGFKLPVSEWMIKDIFREVARAMYKKESTADLSTTEISEVYRVVDCRFAEVTGVTASWPSWR